MTTPHKNASSPAKASHPAPASTAHRVATPASHAPAKTAAPRMNTKVDHKPAPLAPAPQSPVGARVTHAETPPANMEAPAITSAVHAQAGRDEKFSYQIEATNAPKDFTADGLPAGLELDVKTGVISGKADVAGIYPVKIGANGEHGTGHLTLTLTVA